MEETIEIEIDLEGNAKAEVKGVQGAACLSKTSGLLRALGQTTDTQKTDEYHQSVRTGQQQTNQR